MKKLKKDMPASVFTDSWFYRSLPIKAQLFFLSKLSERYHDVPQVLMKEPKEEMIVGYESSWPGAYKQNDL